MNEMELVRQRVYELEHNQTVIKARYAAFHRFAFAHTDLSGMTKILRGSATSLKRVVDRLRISGSMGYLLMAVQHLLQLVMGRATCLGALCQILQAQATLALLP